MISPLGKKALGESKEVHFGGLEFQEEFSKLLNRSEVFEFFSLQNNKAYKDL